MKVFFKVFLQISSFLIHKQALISLLPDPPHCLQPMIPSVFYEGYL